MQDRNQTQSIPSHKPFFHTNQIIFNTDNHTNHLSHEPSLHTIHPFTQTRYYVVQTVINGLSDIWITYCLVCVKGYGKWLHPFTQTIASYKPFIILWITYGKWLHGFTQTIPSHKPFIILCITCYLDCVKGYDKLFVWRDGLHEGMVCVKGCITYCLICVKGLHIVWFVSLHKDQTQSIPSHKPDNHTNHPFTQTIYHLLYYILSSLWDYLVCLPSTQTIYQYIPSHKHKPSLPTNCLSFSLLHIIWYVWRDVITENDKWFVWRAVLCGWFVWKPFIILCITFLHTIHPFTLTIYSHNPFIILYTTSLHTNHPFTQTIPSHKPSLCTNHPFTQTR